jgi:hypothetical protein
VPNAKLPLSFEANQGQTDARVKFLSRGPGYTLFLTGDEAVLGLRKSEDGSPKQHARRSRFGIENPRFANAIGVPRLLIQTPEPSLLGFEPQTANPESSAQVALRVKLLGADSAARVVGEEELPGKANYFIGKDPKKWRTNVPTYAKVNYHDVYPGVDLVYYGNQGGQLEYDFVVAPGADPSAIALAVGAGLVPAQGRPQGSPLRIAADGGLVIPTEAGEVHLQKPLIYQEGSGARREISGEYVLRSACEVTIKLGTYDSTKALVIDPVLAYSTYLGGSYGDTANGIAVDPSGNAYVTGDTASSNFPTTPGAFQTSLSGYSNAFITKLNPAGSALLYSTYLGGSGNAYGAGIAVDALGNAYVTGGTGSSNFPTTSGAFQTSLVGSSAAFVTKLNPAGSELVYSTYLGGSGNTYGQGIAVDASGNAYVTGPTNSSNFPTTSGAFQKSLAGHVNDFVSKLNPSGSALVYSTYLGGSGSDFSYGPAVDPSGNAYVTGYTNSSNFPTTSGAFQTTLTGTWNVFVSKLNPTGSALDYSTYLGGNGFDTAQSIAHDSSGNAYLTGETDSSNFPTTAGAFQTSLLAACSNCSNAFVTKLNPTGSALVYSTYLGGSAADAGLAIAMDPSGNADVIGNTFSNDFPTTPGAFQTSLAGGLDTFLTTLNPSGSALVYSTYLGGSSQDYGDGIAVDALGNAYVTGGTGSSNFPTTSGAFQTSLAGSQNAFVAKFENDPQAQVTNLQSTVKNLVSAGTINSFVGQFLLAPLNAALAALGAGPGTAARAALDAGPAADIRSKLDRSHTAAAIRELDVFIIRVRLLVFIRTLTKVEGQILIDAAESLITTLRS